MAVLVEAISVIVRKDSIAAHYPGGWEAFFDSAPNRTLCADEELARVGFMSLPDVQAYLEHLEESGLTFLRDGRAIDIAVVDQLRGPTTPCDWLEFARLNWNDDGGKVAACWLFEGPRDKGVGMYMKDMSMTISTPSWWEFEGSISEKSGFVPSEEVEERLIYLRHENGNDIYLDRETGEVVYMGRTAREE